VCVVDVFLCFSKHYLSAYLERICTSSKQVFVVCLFVHLCALWVTLCFLLTVYVYYFYGYMCCGDACGAAGIQLVCE
jgi:hypothetical protein